MIIKYICDKCGKEFDNAEDCEVHEKMCGITEEQLNFVAWAKNENKMDFYNDIDFFDECYYVIFNNKAAFDYFSAMQDDYGFGTIDEDIYVDGHIYYYYDVDDYWIDLTKLCKKITKVYDKLTLEIE